MNRNSRWFENLETELTAAKRNESDSNQLQQIYTNQDDQPGPSGINSIANAQDTDQNPEPFEDEDTSEKEPTPVELFADKVTIAGLPEAYNAPWKIDRIMFRMALIAATCMMIYQGIGIGNQYKDHNMITFSQWSTDHAPFPSVTICFPPVFNDLLFSEISTLPKHDYEYMLKHNLTYEDIRNFAIHAFSSNIKSKDIGSRLFQLTRKLFDKSFESSRKVNRNPMKDLLTPTCSQVLSNCEFESQSFDCCEVVKFQTMFTFSCYEIHVNNSVFNKNGSRKSDALQLEKVGLTIDISKDWTRGFFDDEGDASDGFHIFIDALPSRFRKDPVYIPSSMSALVNLAEPKKLSEITKCFQVSQIPKLEYFDHYDSHGIYCLNELTANRALDTVGCFEPIQEYFPENHSCSFQQTVALSLAIGGENTDDSKTTLSRNLKKEIDKSYYAYKLLYSNENSPCLPLCSRWIYPVLSASYASIQYRDKDEEKRQLANRSWSRIRIIMADSSYTIEKEKELAATYLAFCDIGGMMGVWAGFSIITFAEVFFYGSKIVWSKWKKKKEVNKVEPSRQGFSVQRVHPTDVRETNL